MAFSTSSKDVGSSNFGMITVLVDHPEILGWWRGSCLAGLVGTQPMMPGSYPYFLLGSKASDRMQGEASQPMHTI